MTSSVSYTEEDPDYHEHCYRCDKQLHGIEWVSPDYYERERERVMCTNCLHVIFQGEF